MRKILMVAHYSRFLVQFEMNDVRLLQEAGVEVHYATNYEKEDMYDEAPNKIVEAGVILHQIDFVRSPYRIKENVNAYQQLKKLMEQEKFDGVHCHTPMGGMLARLAAKTTKTTPVIYTAHGFHFYKGAPILNWILYYPIEKILSKWTDVLITINVEDYICAKDKMSSRKVEHIPGVGVDVERYDTYIFDKDEWRKSLEIHSDATVFVSVGELNRNKNHETAIRAFLQAEIPNSYYLICGDGELKSRLMEIIREKHAENQVRLLGFCENIPEILKGSDVFVFPSIREGLGLAAIEAMAAGLPVIASKMRGSKEYITPDVTGSFCDATSINDFCAEMKKWEKRINKNICDISKQTKLTAKKFDIDVVKTKMKQIYRTVGWILE
ncbi:MAG: glycosyltransferase family 4 protein [Lachnospiraceae bacterium]|nr:glycosyltransferase family 4 protein [Lachnospiraceae bacterium]